MVPRGCFFPGTRGRWRIGKSERRSRRQRSLFNSPRIPRGKSEPRAIPIWGCQGIARVQVYLEGPSIIVSPRTKPPHIPDEPAVSGDPPGRIARRPSDEYRACT